MEFKPYKDNEYLENSYYKIPQELFVSSLYKDKLNSDSKILYAFLLDRLSLSQKNHWIDDETLELNKEECKMLQKLNSLYMQMCNFEEREIFFLGAREAYYYFKNIGIIN